MNCIIIEDQMPAQRILKKYISDVGTMNLVGTFTDAFAALETIKTREIDLIFLDIHLPKISGIEFLKTLSHPPQVILTTAFSEYALESYELNVVDYLLKPFSFQRFVKAISKVSRNHQNDKLDSFTKEEKEPLTEIFIKSGYDHIKINIKDILFINSDANYTEVHTDEKMHVSSEPLKYWEDLLPKNTYMRIHKSYIINTKKIKKISGNMVFLEEDKKIPLGRAYKNQFKERYIDKWTNNDLK